MGQRSTTERTTKFAATVDDIPDAWVFVMHHLHNVGPHPSVHISPVWTLGENDEHSHYFEVSVEGMIEE